MNLQIIGHETEITEALDQYLRDHLRGFISRFSSEVTNFIVRVCGKKKNGWAPSISFEVRLKNRVITLKKYHSRKFKDFYEVINTAVANLYRKTAEAVGKDYVGRSRQRVGVRKNKRTMYMAAV